MCEELFKAAEGDSQNDTRGRSPKRKDQKAKKRKASSSSSRTSSSEVLDVTGVGIRLLCITNVYKCQSAVLATYTTIKVDHKKIQVNGISSTSSL